MIEVTLEIAPKLAVSRSLVVAPVTVMATTSVSFATVLALAADTPLIVKPGLANLPLALVYSA